MKEMILKIRKYFPLIIFIGFILGLSTTTCFHKTVELTSTNESCAKCHVHPHATESYELSPHYDTRTGVEINCVECHLPPKGHGHIKEKMKAGVRDAFGVIFKDSADFDWEAMSTFEMAQHHVFKESCVNCHKNLFPSTLSIEGHSAHEYYYQNENELRCIKCHTNVGHFHPDTVNRQTTIIESMEDCRFCHQQYHDEWVTSAMNHFNREKNESFTKLLIAREKAKNADLFNACNVCHEPVRMFSGAAEDSIKQFKERISCTFCHSVQIDHANDKFMLNPYNAKMGPVKNANSDFHRVRYSSDHEDSKFCLMCHRNIRGQFEEYQTLYPEDTVSQCQTCHMPLRDSDNPDKGHAHTFMGGFSEEMLQKAVKLDVETQVLDAMLLVQVRIENNVKAHYIPTGSPYSLLVLKVTAYDKSNNPIFQSWKENPFKEAPDAVFGDIMLDSVHHPLGDFERDKQAFGISNRFKTNEIKVVKYSIIENSLDVVRVEAKLEFQSFNPYIAKTIGITDEFYTRKRIMAEKVVFLSSK